MTLSLKETFQFGFLEKYPHTFYAYMAYFVTSIGFYLFIPYSSIILIKDYGISITQYGQLLFIYFIIKHAAMFPMGIVVDKLGQRTMATLGSLLVAVSYAGMMYTTAVIPLGLLFTMSALGSASFQPAAKAYIAQKLADNDRIKAFSIWNMLMNLASILGPLIGIVLSGYSAKAMFISSMLCYVAGSFSIAIAPRQVSSSVNTSSNSQLYEEKRTEAKCAPVFAIFCIASIGFYFLLSQYMVCFPIMIEEQVGRGAYGLIFSMCAVIAVLLQSPVTKRLENRFSVFTISSVAMLMFCCGYGILLIKADYRLIAITMMLFTFSKIFYLPMADAYVASIAPPSRIGGYFGFSSISMAIGGSLGYMYGAKLYEHFVMGGNLYTFWIIMMSISLLSGLVFALLNIKNVVNGYKSVIYVDAHLGVGKC